MLLRVMEKWLILILLIKIYYEGLYFLMIHYVDFSNAPMNFSNFFLAIVNTGFSGMMP